MKPFAAIVIVLVIAVVVIVSAFVVRDGLLAIATEIRDKSLPELPDELIVNDVTIDRATITHQPGGDGNMPGVTLTIENMRIDTPFTRPSTE